MVEQMEKDLALSGLQYQFTKMAAADLVKELSIVLDERDKHGQLSNVLYRVDINPSSLKDFSYPGLAELIWNRELKKVMFRKLYSKHNEITDANTAIE